MKDRDKFLAEAMGGKTAFFCFIEDERVDNCVLQKDNHMTFDDCIFATTGSKPEDCEEWKEDSIDGPIDFSIWEGFGKLWEWAEDKPVSWKDTIHGGTNGHQ